MSMLPQPTGDTHDEREKDRKKKYEEHMAARDQAAVEAWRVLKSARDEAECLLDHVTFEAFDALYQGCDSAHAEIWAGRLTEDHREMIRGNQRARAKPEVVNAIRKLIRE